jgi:dTMP kinase
MQLFITLEGIEGSGKSTQLRHLSRLLEQRGFETTVTREPGGCSISDSIRAILLDPANQSMVTRTELLLYAAARAQHVEEVIRPALADDRVVICDRFYDATTAYQGAGRGLDPALIDALNQLATDGLTPDLTLLFDFPAEQGLTRARQRNSEASLEAEGRFEMLDIEFHQRVRMGYLSLARQNDRFHIIDASGDEEVVAARVASATEAFLATKGLL